MSFPLTLFVAAALAAHPVAPNHDPAPHHDPAAVDDPLQVSAPSLAERIYGLSSLWSEAKFSFAFFDQVPDLDWDAAYQEFIPRVAGAETMYAYYRELQAFVALLEDGHSGVTMPHALQIDVVPLWIDVVGGRYIVERAERSLVDQVPVGSEIVAVGGVDVQEHVASEVAPFVAQSTPQARALEQATYLLSAPRGEQVPFTIVTPEGRHREVHATTGRFYGSGNEYLPGLPRYEPEVEWVDEGIAKVTLVTFSDPSFVEQFEALVPELQAAEGIVLDLRWNNGGATGTATGILRHFADRDLEGCSWSTREHRAAHRVWGKYRNGGPDDYGRLDAWTAPERHPLLRVETAGPLAGKPLAILTDTDTVSAAEDFLIYADPLDQATRIGRPTMGTTGQPLPILLPGGGAARICTKRDTWPDGTDFVGVGVQPDILVPRTVEDIRDGVDRTLVVAIDHLKGRIRASAGSGD